MKTSLLLSLIVGIEACASGGDVCVGPSCNPPRFLDGAIDAARDATWSDTPLDAANPVADIGADGARDAQFDARQDAGFDVAVDTARDVGTDTRDAAVADVREAAVDLGVDTGRDTGVTSSEVCGTANEGGTVTLRCPGALVIRQIVVASYGTVSGTCPDITPGSCHAPSSSNVVGPACLGQSRCSVDANNGVFADPCEHTVKRLGIRAICRE